MSFKSWIQLRRLSTSKLLWRPALTANYKSPKLWQERFNCRLLGDEDVIKVINNKILMGDPLNNLETDIFINIASSRTDEIAQLQESARLLAEFRKTIAAHTLLPSTHHAVCRLFLESERLSSLAKLLVNRVKYGIFPDFFAMNLILDEALEKKNYACAAKFASLCMYQEEFGIHPITDRLSLFSVVKYIESKSNFEDWENDDPSGDDVLRYEQLETTSDSRQNKEEAEKKDGGDSENEEEDEDDAEYIRVPFLRNPYNDDHFDLTNPRVICGKTLSMLSRTLPLEEKELRVSSNLIGSLLEGKWTKAIETLDISKKSGAAIGPTKELAIYYIENLHSVEEPTDEQKAAILVGLKEISNEVGSLSELAESSCQNFEEIERSDIDNLMKSLVEWSRLREDIKKRRDDKSARDKLIAEIKAKKEAIKLKEQYLYFYENLKKKHVTRITYD